MGLSTVAYAGIDKMFPVERVSLGVGANLVAALIFVVLIPIVFRKMCLVFSNRWNPIWFLLDHLLWRLGFESWAKINFEKQLKGSGAWELLVLFSSLLTGKEWVVLELCSFVCMNQNNPPNWAESDATLPPIVLALPERIHIHTAFVIKIIFVTKFIVLFKFHIRKNDHGYWKCHVIIQAWWTVAWWKHSTL